MVKKNKKTRESAIIYKQNEDVSKYISFISAVCVLWLQVIWCFLYTLYTHLFIAGAVIALFVEVNSITLHLRLMLKLASAQDSSLYYVNKFVNLITYVTFRLSAQFYLTWYLTSNYSSLEHSGYFLTSIMVMNIMILIYFYRLLRADFFPRKTHFAGQNGVHRNNSKKFLSDWLRKVVHSFFVSI